MIDWLFVDVSHEIPVNILTELVVLPVVVFGYKRSVAERVDIPRMNRLFVRRWRVGEIKICITDDRPRSGLENRH